MSFYFLPGYTSQHLPVSFPPIPPSNKKVGFFSSVLLLQQCLGASNRIPCFKCCTNKYFPRVSQENQSTKSCYSRKIMPVTGLQALTMSDFLLYQRPLKLSKRIQVSYLKYSLPQTPRKHGLQSGRIKDRRAMEE